MKTLLAILAAGFAFTCPACLAAHADQGIPVLVTEEGRVARQSWPLTFGVPFPAGALIDPGSVTVTMERGVSEPVQTRVLSRWVDGSVRWLLVDTQVTLAPRASLRLRVDKGRAPAPATRLRVDDGSEAIAVDTGAIRFQVPRKRFAIVEDLRPAGDSGAAAGPMSAALLVDGQSAVAQPPREVRVLENGPLRARIELRGEHGRGFDYVLRIDAYAGQPFLRVFHTFIDKSGRTYSAMSRLGVELALDIGGAHHYAAGVESSDVAAGSLGDRPLRLAQIDESTYRIGDAERRGKLAGWVELRGKKAAAGLAARWLWQEYPKAIELAPDRLVYDLWAPETPPAKVGMGAAKTHEFVLWIGTPREGRAPSVVAEPLVAAVDPAWIAATGALPQAIAAPAGGFVDKVVAAAERYRRRNDREQWDDSGSIECANAQRERRRNGAYGMWNWGDWNFPGYHDDVKGCDAWGNLEYDTTQVLALAFAASGRPDLQRAMVAAARHFMDVDRIHSYPPRPAWVGMNHPKNPLHFTFELGGVDLGHTWNEGLLSYFYLTGDERGLDAALGVADYLVSRIDGFVLRANPRQWGWPQVALVAAYEATRDEKYRAAARAYAERGMEAHAPTSIQKWKLGVLADALAYTHSVTRDRAIEKWLGEYVAAVAQRKVPLDPRVYPAVAYVGRLRGDPGLLETARARADKLDLGSWGKPFTLGGRLGFRIYSLLAPRAGTASSPARAAGDEDRTLGFAVAPQQDVEGAGAAVARPGTGEGEHEPGPGAAR